MKKAPKPSARSSLPNGLFDWKVKEPLQCDGVIVGCDSAYEWMLPWWWVHYRLQNDYPVTFIDFGDMSENAKDWCRAKGQLLTLDIPVDEFLTSKDNVCHTIKPSWEIDEGSDVWVARHKWFKKPFACLQSPYQRTVWIDLDCQVRRPIKEVFDYCNIGTGISLAREIPEVIAHHARKGRIHQDEIEYNSGVIVFKHGIPLIEEWARRCVEMNDHLRGDQEVMSRLLYDKKVKFIPLLPEYNVRWHAGLSMDDVIIHWLGTGKDRIKDQINIMKKALLIDLSFDLF